MFAHSLEDQVISDVASSSLLGVTFHSQEQPNIPLMYTQSDHALAQEMEKQVCMSCKRKKTGFNYYIYLVVENVLL